MESDTLFFPVSCKCCCLSFQLSVNGVIFCPDLCWLYRERVTSFILGTVIEGGWELQMVKASIPICLRATAYSYSYIFCYFSLKANRFCKAKMCLSKDHAAYFKYETHSSFMDLTLTFVAVAVSTPPLCSLPPWRTAHVSLLEDILWPWKWVSLVHSWTGQKCKSANSLEQPWDTEG